MGKKLTEGVFLPRAVVKQLQSTKHEDLKARILMGRVLGLYMREGKSEQVLEIRETFSSVQFQLLYKHV